MARRARPWARSQVLPAGDATARHGLCDRRPAVSRLPPQDVRIGLAAPGRRCGNENDQGGVHVAEMLQGKKVAILAADMFERVELEEPRKALEDAGADVEIVSIHDGEIQGFDHFDPAKTVKVDRTIEEVSADDYDALLIPGGVGNPDQLRGDENA